MRRLRWLLPVAIVCIVAAVGSIYVKQRDKLASEAPPRPERLPEGVQGQSSDWCYAQSEGDRTHVEICAAKFKEIGDMMELQGVKLKLHHADGTEFDQVSSDAALFDKAAKTLYSEGAVEITLGVPEGQQPVGRLLGIHTSGVKFSSETGIAETTQALSFEFDRGGGSAVGGRYDPQSRALQLDSQVSLDWRGKAGITKPVHIEGGKAWYFEREAKVHIEPWTKLTRESLNLDAGPVDVFLENGDVRRADAKAARGVQKQPGRQVDFAAEELYLQFDDGMLVKNIHAARDARLVSAAATARTTVRGDILDLQFAPLGDESALQWAVATGNGVVEAEPVGNRATADKRVLRSDVIRMNMRAGGEEIEIVQTDGPATLDLIPSLPEQPKRNVRGDKFVIDYAAANKIEKFRTTNAHTRTERPNRAVMETHSKELTAFFDPTSSALTRLEQTTDFRYEEGLRRASSDRATLEQAKELVTLNGNARSSDPTGSVRADTLTLNQKSGDFTAEGHVATSREPERKGNASSNSAMLSTEAPMQASADRMTSSNEGKVVHYEGSAKAWQGANRVEADRIDLDNQRGVMEAHGKVVTQIYDQKKSAGSSGLTKVQAPDLIYLRDTRVAHYTGGVTMERPGASPLTVTSGELQAFLSDSKSESSLERAVADGNVKIVSTTTVPNSKTKRVRTATSQHADYSAKDQQVILTGGRPLLVDSLKGQSQGEKVTFWINDDRVLIEGEERGPVKTTIKR